jgi:hypothetical protein
MSQLEPVVEIDEEVFQPGESHSTVTRLSLTAALGGSCSGMTALSSIAPRRRSPPISRDHHPFRGQSEEMPG